MYSSALVGWRRVDPCALRHRRWLRNWPCRYRLGRRPGSIGAFISRYVFLHIVVYVYIHTSIRCVELDLRAVGFYKHFIRPLSGNSVDWASSSLGSGF